MHPRNLLAAAIAADDSETLGPVDNYVRLKIVAAK